MYFTVAIVWLYTLLISIFTTCESNTMPQSLTTNNQGRCRGLWRNDKLIGKCFGLSPFKRFFEENKNTLQHLKHMIPSHVNSATECKRLCCNIGLECVTWQYQPSREVPCKIGGPVRLGLEVSGVANWCEPLPPATWSGYRLERRKITSTASSSADASVKDCDAMKGATVPHQCFGLGPERMHPVTRKPLSVSECEAACCADPRCEVWQAIAGRGCFYNRNEGVHCEEKGEPAYTGGRKCVPGVCGSLENEKMMLSQYNKSAASSAIF
jgi:hypothetical protein